MSERPWHSDNDTAERNEKARKAYESLMTVTLRKPTSPEYRTFSNLVKKRAERKYPNFTYGEDEVRTARVWGGRGWYSRGIVKTRLVQQGYGEDEVGTADVWGGGWYSRCLVKTRLVQQGYGEDQVGTAVVWGGRGWHSRCMGRTRLVQQMYGEEEVVTADVVVVYAGNAVTDGWWCMQVTWPLRLSLIHI